MSIAPCISIEEIQCQLGEIIKPFQQDVNRRQKQCDFMKKCIQCTEKNDFFQLDELLKSKQATEVRDDESLNGLTGIFSQLQAYADEQIELYRVEFRNGLEEAAKKMDLPIHVDIPKFFVIEGIEGEVDFAAKKTKIGEITIKSFDPRRIVAVALSLKRKLYDTPFEPRLFIHSLFACYEEIIKKERQGIGYPVSIQQLYTEYVWSLQSKAFFQNMDKSKFKGYSVDQFAVDFWRFFTSDLSTTDEGYSIRLGSGRMKSLWLIDQLGKKRQFSHLSFVKSDQ